MSKFELGEKMYYTVSAGEGVFLDMTADSFYGLDEIGTTIIDLILQGESTEYIASRLHSEYESDFDTLRHVVDEFVSDLTSRGFLKVGD